MLNWFKKFKKTRKPSLLPLPSNTAPQTDAEPSNTALQTDAGPSNTAPQTDAGPPNTAPQTGAEPSSTGAGSNQGVESGGVNNGNTPGSDRGTEGRRHRKAKQERVVISVNNTKKPTDESRALKAVLAAVSAIYLHCEESAPVADKVEALISRIITLEEIFGTPADDVVEQSRRDPLIQKVHHVEAGLQSLYRRPPPHQLQDGGDIPELLEDLREAIFDYQMAQQTELCTQEHMLISSVEAAVFDNFPCSRRAEFLRGSWRGCLKGTRRAVLDEIELWARNFNRSPVYWLNGLARTGKTAIAQTIAERAFADGRLGAAFFCSRGYEDRSNPHLIFCTIAVQLARKYADFRSFFIPLVQSNPGIAYESLDKQMQKLIVQPLQESNVSTLVIIDALDECEDQKPTSAILSVLAQFVSEIPKVKFLITGRPETNVWEGFRLPLLAEEMDVFVLHEVERSKVDNDVRLLFKQGFSEVAGLQHGSLFGRPTGAELDDLCASAAGSFVYAVAAIKFINARSGNPTQRLNLILDSSRRSTHETKIKPNEESTLDLFYELILQGVFPGRRNLENDRKVFSVLGAIALAANPLSPSTVAALLGLDIDEVFRLLSSTRPILVPQKDIHSPVRPFHKPFLGFIVNPRRCKNKRFHVSPSDSHPQLLMGCLNLMARTLERNMCKFPDGAVNEDIGDLRQRIERYIDPALIYACKSWHLHLVDRYTMSADTSGITLAIRRFLETKFLFWLEVLSVLGAVGNAVDALQAVADWLEESSTLDLVNDYSRFVTSYFEIISASCSHIYHSALVLTPKSSIVRHLYEAHARPLTRVVCGIPVPLGSATFATGSPFEVKLIVWSPCNRYLAISPSESVTVAILDSTTLRRVQNLEFEREAPSSSLALIFSPDSRILTCSCTGDSRLPFCVVSWEIRTGRIVSAIEQPVLDVGFSGRPLLTYSTDGRMVGILYRYSTSATISVFNVVSGVHLHNVPHGVEIDSRLGGQCFCNIWTHGESLRFATAEPGTITIRKVGFTAYSTPTEVATFSISANVHHVDAFKLPPTSLEVLPAAHRVALTHFSGPVPRIIVWDPQNSDPLLLYEDQHLRSPVTLSSDGRFLACSTTGPEFYLWKGTSAGYVLAAKLPSSTQSPSLLFSPNGESIVVYGDSTIQLWRTNAFVTTTITTTTTPSSTTTAPSSSSVSALPQQTEDFVLDFHPVRPLAAFARRKGTTVTILNLDSGLPQLTINTGVGVLGIGVVGGTVVAAGDGIIVTWKLPEGECLPDATMDPQDGVQTIYLNDKRRNNVVAALISFDLSHVAFITQSIFSEKSHLQVYNASTGRRVGYASVEGNAPRFAPDKPDIWCAVGNKAKVWAVTQNGLYESTHAREVEGEPLKLPWGPPCGYQATKDGWILGPGGKRLFLLPLPLRSHAVVQVWKGQYLALLHSSLSEPVILKLGP